MHYCNEPLESKGSKDLSNIDLKDVRGGGPHKLNNYFSLQNIMSPVVILSSVPRTFSQDCRYEVEKQANEKQERKLNDCFESVGW